MPAKSSHAAIRQYIKNREHEFPIICQITRDFITILATFVLLERVFSLASNLISKTRTNISSKNVCYVLCLRS